HFESMRHGYILQHRDAPSISVRFGLARCIALWLDYSWRDSGGGPIAAKNLQLLFASAIEKKQKRFFRGAANPKLF
ncbi:MAG: hypothetical protein PHP45_09980, partial [Elusimicrobiales bacterium]|nr:hypothetical protein [Elusimicrobiales bacterium]